MMGVLRLDAMIQTVTQGSLKKLKVHGTLIARVRLVLTKLPAENNTIAVIEFTKPTLRQEVVSAKKSMLQRSFRRMGLCTGRE